MDSRKNPEYHAVAAITEVNCIQTKTVLQNNHGKTMLKTSSILDLTRPSPPNILDSLNTVMQRTTNENAAGLLRKI